jgi:hypothetical protein
MEYFMIEEKQEKIPSTNRDSAWKDILDVYFREFMEFFYPKLAKLIDWSAGYEILDKELQMITTESMIGKRFVDKLIKVTLFNDGERWLQIHIEVQGESESNFGQRMFRYYYRLYDRYDKPIISLAILTDDNASWRPRSYRQEVVGMEVLTFHFLSTKLLDYRNKIEELEQTTNPFGTVVLVCLAALNARKDSEKRFEYKVSLTKRLYDRGLKRDDVWNLYKFIDWVITLPESLEIRYNEHIHKLEEELNMPYITSAERIGMEKGKLEGNYIMILRLLRHKFREVPEKYSQCLAQADAETLEVLAVRVLDATCLEEVFSEH